MCGLLEEHDDAILSLNVARHLAQCTGIRDGLAHPNKNQNGLVTRDERVQKLFRYDALRVSGI